MEEIVESFVVIKPALGAEVILEIVEKSGIVVVVAEVEMGNAVIAGELREPVEISGARGGQKAIDLEANVFDWHAEQERVGAEFLEGAHQQFDVRPFFRM